MIEAFARVRARAVSLGTITALWLSVVVSPAAAQLKDIRGAKDNSVIKRYEGSVIIGYY